MGPWSDSDGSPRYSCLYESTNASTSNPLPLVVFLHPSLATADTLELGTNILSFLNTANVTDNSSRLGFIALAPEGRDTTHFYPDGDASGPGWDNWYRHVAAHKGFEVKALGDGFMIAFSSARRALLCASEVQRSFAAYCSAHPDLPIRVRMGLHVGETISESSDFFGKAVIQAARIAALAHGGQILISSTLHDLGRSAGDLRFAPAGEKQLKGLAGTYQIFELVW